MKNLEKVVRKEFMVLGWKLEAGPNTIKLMFRNHEIVYDVIIKKIGDSYFWLYTKKEDEEVKNVAGSTRGTWLEILQSMEQYILGMLKLYTIPKSNQ